MMGGGGVGPDGFFSLAFNFWFWSRTSDLLSVLADGTATWKEKKFCREQRSELKPDSITCWLCSAWASDNFFGPQFLVSI